MDPIDVITNWNIRSVSVKSREFEQSLNRGMLNKFESRKMCVAGYQCDNSDFDFCIAEPVSVKRRLRTADCGPGVKCRLCVKCRLHTKSKMQTGVKCRPSINCSRGRV